ncbi:GNAT family N-acetyltransferase [Roseibium sediminicola]|uniref:GNAT family N-acetyltransferase n=1 Tax=Roseibium sediminicola TaxID=2933272 RepID=A0ABT0GN02_9HYPH|nr:GNAT family N-acetyltransferase [Roseibium sp. CAU 1639]MCK7610784.1 GNAT family N-acetyltransferase [Roseibium sp. CAU 1639]
MSAFKIEAATPLDARSLAALSIEVWLDTYATEGISDSFAAHVLETYTPEAFAGALADRNKYLLVARNDVGLMGYVLLNLKVDPVSPGSGTAEFETLYVRRHHQRLGLGRRLFDNALKLAAAAGQEKLFLTVYEKNDRAIAFYEALGMRHEGRWTFEFEGGAVPNLIMVRETDM